MRLPRRHPLLLLLAAVAIIGGFVVSAFGGHGSAGGTSAPGQGTASAIAGILNQDLLPPPPCEALCHEAEAAANAEAAEYGWTGRQASCLDTMWMNMSGFDPYYEGTAGEGIPYVLLGWTLAPGRDWQYDWNIPPATPGFQNENNEYWVGDNKGVKPAEIDGGAPVRDGHIDWVSPPPTALTIDVQVDAGLQYILTDFNAPCYAMKLADRGKGVWAYGDPIGITP